MDYIAIHKKWREYWRANGTHKFDINSKKPKYYCLEMFPYPSGANLHLGHFMNYAPSDTHARFKKMCGCEVFQPMGFDAFGLPAENFALKTGTHPSQNTYKNMAKMSTQLDELGGMYDWDYSVTTCAPDYYKWTQWLFVKLFEAGLAYQKEAPVNYCPSCNTVLANEQVKDGTCERCEHVVIRKNMKQWFFAITKFAEELLDGLDKIDWPVKTKTMQRNWIGKSVGSQVSFKVDGLDAVIDVFTTRVDTLFGCTFITIAPEHVLAEKLITKEHEKECRAYIEESAKKAEIERLGSDTEKTGVLTGSYAINPINGERVPIYLGDYVIATYGTGAVMAVPAHDERDFVFAEKYNIEIRSVVEPSTKGDDFKLPYCEDGVLVNSGDFSGMTSEKAREGITNRLALQKEGKFQITYRLRDWGVGRQRYWGCPIPIVYCDKCGIVAETRLPVILPNIDDFSPKGSAPLASHEEFINCTCPKCGAPAKRECDTMDTFVCSSWYFLRYPDAKNADEPFTRKNIEKFLPVDTYIGGPEHACMHLLYARFITMFLHSRGYLNFKEPFTRLVHQGMILGTDGQKMSKSKHNTKEPDEYTQKYGSDLLRLFIMFSFNYIEGGPWNDGALKSLIRFTNRIEMLVSEKKGVLTRARAKIEHDKLANDDKELLYLCNKTINSVRNDLEVFSFNTGIARCMELLNGIYDYKALANSREEIVSEAVINLVILLAPFMPHIGEELYEILGGTSSVFDVEYPKPDTRFLVRDTVEIVVQINSKIITRISIAPNATKNDVVKMLKNDSKFVEASKNRTVKNIIYITGKLINFIVG